MLGFRSNFAALFLLLSVRLQSALWSVISDCDETFNYWEPLHYLLKGRGFQTWEYSPEFALRSYSYLWLHALPAKLLALLVENGIVIFYFIRCLLGITCALLEYHLYKALKWRCGATICNMWLVFQLVSPGMFISSAALLPSSFAMYVTIATMTAWLNDNTKTAIAVTALSGLIGWPFAVIVSIPFVLELLVKYRKIGFLCKNALIFGAVFGIPIIIIDSAHFGSITVAALNIIRYNVFTSHGPDLYGVEPASFYVKNLFLNHNIVLPLTLAYPVLVLVATGIGVKYQKKRLSPLRGIWLMSPLVLWLAVFSIQPHKEERFIFPIYPLFSLGGALLMDVLFNFTRRFLGVKKSAFPNRVMTIIVFGIALAMGLSRILAVSLYYRAPMVILSDLPPMQSETNVCYGKEWYRFPGSFFLSANYRVRFVESSFKGMLPAYFHETANGTQLVHEYFNDKNLGHPHMLFDLNLCDFLVDLDTGVSFNATSPEPNFSADKSTWSVVKSVDFVQATHSKSFARAFYVPLLSHRYLAWGKYSILKRLK
ncbi:alpha-1,2-mannosyltransferase ALG9 [Anopheles nili]|uniref:alpha-1,2-mannosyltransferase ALG9 n=1 Tax=Anopheles nili TaxID=185578 RepID=UPI00237C0F8A|nr:alpha-1,2-mannosyltransferase ALG9 [Anopheles nili]